MTETKAKPKTKRKSRAIPKSQHKKDGRPMIVFTPDQVIELEGLAAVLNKQQLAHYFNVSESTLQDIEKRQPEVFTAYNRGRSKTIATVACNLIAQANSGNVAAATFYLKTQGRWKETTHVQQETKEVKSFSDMYED